MSAPASGGKPVAAGFTWAALAALLIALPVAFPSVLALSILNQMGIAIVFALSYNMLLGQGGMLSFGHAVYFGLGGFFAVHVLNLVESHALALPLPLVPVLGGLFGLLFAALIGLFSTRRAGTVFAMISLGIGELIAACSIIFVAFFGGEEGVSGDRTMGPALLGIDFARDRHVYYVVATWVFVSMVLMYLFTRTPAGRMANAVRDNPARAEFIGYSQRTVRLISFCASGFFAGVAGGLFAINYEILTEENLNLASSGAVLLMAYVGGVGYFAGPVIGAVLLTLLQTVLSNYTELWQLYVGLLFLATVLFAPNGLAGLVMMHERALRLGRLRSLVAPYLRAFLPAFAATLAAAGLLELVHFVNEAATDEHVTSLYAIELDARDVGPWVVLIAVTCGGALLARRAWPRLRQAWDSANDPRAITGSPRAAAPR